MLSKPSSLSLVGFLLALTILTGQANAVQAADKDEQEREVTLDQVPAKVKATILKAAGKNDIKEVEEVILKLFEVEWTKSEKEIEVYLTPNGKVLMKKVEKEEDAEEEVVEHKEKAEGEAADQDDDGEVEEKKIGIDELPAKVKAAVKKLAGKNDIKLEELRVRFYEATWLEGGKEVEILVATDGKRVKDAGSKPKKKGKASGRKKGKEKRGDDGDEREEKDQAASSSPLTSCRRQSTGIMDRRCRLF